MTSIDIASDPGGTPTAPVLAAADDGNGNLVGDVAVPPPPGVSGRRAARLLGLFLRALWVALFIGFHAWNFAHYEPARGYDGPGHIRVLQTYHATGHAPAKGYGVSNPPLYYMLAGALWGLTNSLKVVQALSLVLFCCNVWIVKRLLWSATSSQPLRWASLTFVAFLPVHLTYAYMVFDYALAHAEELATIYFLYTCARRPRVWRIVAAGLATSLGVFTALTSLYLVPLGVFTAFFFGPRSLKRRLLWVGAFVLAIAGPLAPYYVNRQHTQRCFFCTSHRIATTKSFTQVYPPLFYVNFSFRGLAQPYFPFFVHDSLWNLVYETAFGDYFGYLIPQRLAEGAPHRGLDSTGRHYLDKPREKQLILLNFLAMPACLALLAGFAHAARRSFDWVRRARHARPPLSLWILVASGLAMAQFLAYIHKYPNFVNIHAGYILILFILGPVEVARALKSRRGRVLLEASFFVYAAAVYWIFLLR